MGIVVRNLWTFFGDELFERALSDRSEDRRNAKRSKCFVVFFCIALFGLGTSG